MGIVNDVITNLDNLYNAMRKSLYSEECFYFKTENDLRMNFEPVNNIEWIANFKNALIDGYFNLTPSANGVIIETTNNGEIYEICPSAYNDSYNICVEILTKDKTIPTYPMFLIYKNNFLFTLIHHNTNNNIITFEFVGLIELEDPDKEVYFIVNTYPIELYKFLNGEIDNINRYCIDIIVNGISFGLSTRFNYIYVDNELNVRFRNIRFKMIK